MKKTMLAVAMMGTTIISQAGGYEWEGIYSVTPNRETNPVAFVTLQENSGTVVMAVLGANHEPWEAYVGTVDPAGRIDMSLEFAPSDGTQSSLVGLELNYRGEVVLFMDWCASRWVKAPYFAPDGFNQRNEHAAGGSVNEYDDALSYTIEYEWVEKGCFIPEGSFAKLKKVF